MRKKFKNYSDFIEYFRSFEIDKLEKSEDIFFVYGIMKDLSVLKESPFTDRGSVVEIFTDMTLWMNIKKVIDQINANAVA